MSELGLCGWCGGTGQLHFQPEEGAFRTEACTHCKGGLKQPRQPVDKKIAHAAVEAAVVASDEAFEEMISRRAIEANVTGVLYRARRLMQGQIDRHEFCTYLSEIQTVERKYAGRKDGGDGPEAA